MANRIFRCGEPDTYVVASRDFVVGGRLVVRKGQVVGANQMELLCQDFAMEQIEAGTKVENTTTLRKVR